MSYKPGREMAPSQTRRVLFFRPQLGDGGADRVTITLLRHLDRSRFEPVIALVKRTGELLGEVPDDVEVVDLGASRLALAAPALARTISRLAPDVVICTAGGANVIAVAAHRLARSRARLVLSERNAVKRDVGAIRTVVERGIKRVAYRMADEITAVSDGVAEDLISDLRLPRERVRVVYNPVIHPGQRELAAAAVEHPWFTSGTPPLIAVGRLVEQKDYPTMFDAFRRILEGAPSSRLAIFGKGPLRAALEQRVGALGLADRIQFFGFDPNPFRYMARASVMLQSSRAEGLPGTIIQSMGCGTPVVSTDCDHGPREVIDDGANGYLVPVGDANRLADRALELLADPGLRARFSAAAASAAQRFTIENSMRRYEAALTGVEA
ncbi:MAG: glycosyltransferase [Deltaproteobacteria bacterium]|nr:glycosyltransferase [Deltaproteobacteria bacterium]